MSNQPQQNALKPARGLLGQRLRAHRQRRGYTQYRLGQLAKLAPSLISRLESGQRAGTLRDIDAIANALRLSERDSRQLEQYWLVAKRDERQRHA